MAVPFVLVISFFIFVALIAARLLFSLYALHLGAQPLTVGLLSATASIFPMLLSVAAGKLADRYGSRWFVLISISAGALALLLPYFVPALPSIFIAAAITGMAFTFYGVSLQNDIGLLSNASNRAQNFSNFSLMGSVVNLAGPLFVGFSIDYSGPTTTCLYLSLLSLLPITMLVLWGGLLPKGSHKNRAPAQKLLQSLTNPEVWKVLVTSSLVISSIDLFQFYMPIYGHSLGLSASAIGVLVGTFAVAGIVVRLMLKRLLTKFKEDTVLAYAFYLGAVSFMLIPFFKSFLMLMLLAFIFGLGIGCSNPIITMLMFARSAEGRTGEALGLRITANHMTRAVGPVIFGSLGSAFGLFAVFWTSALLLGTGGYVSRPKK